MTPRELSERSIRRAVDRAGTACDRETVFATKRVTVHFFLEIALFLPLQE
jgi:hypothetical protein